MHHQTPYGANAYRAIGIETGVAAADPLGLVVMLYDGAIHAIARAETHLAQGEIEARGTYTSKAIDIVNQGLAASLDKRIGGSLAASLAALYEYMARRLFAANLHGDRAIYAEIRGLLGELRESWVTLRKSQASGDAVSIERMQRDSARPDATVAFGRSVAA
jgi:flagellar protein FliS